MEPPFSITFKERYRLGKRAFFLFLMQRIKLLICLLAMTLLFWYFDGWIPSAYIFINNYVIYGGLLLFTILFVYKIIRTYFEYIGYSFTFENEYFEITRGYMVKSEITIAYHQIQHVNVRRNFLDHCLGICHLILVLAGGNNTKDIVLPAVSTTKARVVQQELMRQARRHFYRTGADAYPREETPKV